jgi:4-amino-4-deoxy-L-arabinose transferase-like glycosyltransferase
VDGRFSSLSVSSSLLPDTSTQLGGTGVSPVAERSWRLSLILPAYNEEAGIAQAVEEACRALAELTRAYEVLVVDDGSNDATAAIVAELAARRPEVRLLRHEINRGYGAALRTGFAAARFERVAFTDADCQFHLADLGRLLPLSDRYPLVVGWREDRQDSWRRRFLSRGYNLLTRTLLGTRVRDCDCALKVFQRAVLPELMPRTNTFFVNAEMLTTACQRGLKVAEVGVRHRPRLRGQSKVSLREMPRILATLLPFWWSRVLFPTWRAGGGGGRRRRGGRGAPGGRWGGGGGGGGWSPPPPPPGSPGTFVLLALIAVTLFFLRLRAPLLEPQEPRYAEIPRQMLSEGSLLVPVLHGQPYLDKPPLLYWLVMGSYSVFGVHDWAARLVPGLAGVLAVLLTYWWGRRVTGERAGLCGALILCLSAGFVYRQRMLNMDGLLCLWVTSALASAHVALMAPLLRWRWWLLSAAACALGLLTKGPVALVLVLAPLLVYARLEPRCARVSWRHGSIFVLVAAALAAPWYVAVMLRQPRFAYEFFWRHHVERFLTPFDHEKPAWYYLPGLLAGMLPWTLLLPGFARYLGRRSLRAARRRPAALGFFLLASLFCLLFFSLSGCKRPGYVLPALPPLALALGCYLNQLLPLGRRAAAGASWGRWWQRGSRLAGAATLLVLTLALGILAVAGVKQMLRPAPLVLMELLLLSAAAWFAFRRVSWGTCVAVTFVVLTVGVHHLQPAYNRQFALRGPLRLAIARTKMEGVPVACYPRRWDSVHFYLPHADVRVYAREQRQQLLSDLRSQPRTLLLVNSGKALDELLRELPDSLEFVSRGRPGLVAAGWVRPRPEPRVEAE